MGKYVVSKQMMKRKESGTPATTTQAISKINTGMQYLIKHRFCSNDQYASMRVNYSRDRSVLMWV